MILAPYADYYARALALSGTAAARVDGTDETQIRALIEGRLRMAWHHYWWPETMRVEERAYRDDYATGTTYAEGDEVYYPTNGKYYTALGATTGNAPTDATYWAELTDLSPPEVAFAQTGKTAIGMVRSATTDDPLAAPRLRRLPFVLTATGVRIVWDTVPRTIYLWFQLRPPELSGATFSGAATYVPGDRVYFASGTGDYRGDFWVCLTATTAGESPLTTAAKWERVELPRFLLEAVAQGAAADMLRAGGKFEAGSFAEARAEDALVKEQDKLVGRQLQNVGSTTTLLAGHPLTPSV